MKSILALSLLSIISIMGISSAYADTSADVAIGSSAPGCENTDECYLPYQITTETGETVTWNNIDSSAHTVTSGTPNDGPDGMFDSSLFMSGNSFSTTFDQPGNYPYFCMVHPWMVGMIVVGEGGDTNPVPVPTPVPIIDDPLEAENEQLKQQNTELKLENRQLKNQIKSLNVEIDSLKDQIVSMIKEFVDSLQQLNSWFRSQLS